MRILHLDSGKTMRGGQWQALALHRGLIERGHDSFLTAPAQSPLLEAARREHLPCEPSSVRRLPALSAHTDMVHAHDAASHTHAALLSRAPFVVSRRVAFEIRKSLASRVKYRRAALFLAVSQYVANELMKAGVEQSRITIVHDGVAIPSNPACGDDIITPFSDDPKKGMAIAVEAAKVGGFVLKVSRELPADLRRARALIYLTQSEGLGSGILLGMAYGLTVIASRVGGIPEVIDDGVNGWLVENTAKSVASAVGRISPQIGAAARLTAQRRFSEGAMIESTVRAYEQVLANA